MLKVWNGRWILDLGSDDEVWEICKYLADLLNRLALDHVCHSFATYDTRKRLIHRYVHVPFQQPLLGDYLANQGSA